MIERVPLREVIIKAQELQASGRYAESRGMIERVIGQHPDNPYLIYVYATGLMYEGSFGLAAVLLLEAIKLNPDFAEAYNNLSVCYRREYHIDKAREMSHKAIELRPDWADPYNNLAATYVNEGCPDEGIEYADLGIKYENDGEKLDKIRWNKSLMLLETASYAQGFGLYDSGIRCGERPRRNYSEDDTNETPYLDNINELDASKTVVVYGEQGMGDEIMFLACLQNVIDTGAKVILDCHPRMMSLFHRSFPDIEIHGTRKRDTVTWPLDREIDYCVAVGSLPNLYLQSHDTFEQRPYIKTETKISDSMARDIRKGDNRPVIGIAWTGGTKKTNNLYRSLDKDLVDLVTSNDAFNFVSLQYDNDGHMPENVTPTWDICQHFNYDLTACLVEACDAVVAINTSVVHLAGAMGKRVFCLTPSRPAWRYGVKGEGMPFYPDVHQYRQQGEDWTSAIEEVAMDMNTWANLSFAGKVAV